MRKKQVMLKHQQNQASFLSLMKPFIKDLFFLCLFSFSIAETEQLKFSLVHIPALVQKNTNYWLSCQFELNLADYNDQLYSIKWYKNNEEFYRLLFSSHNYTAQNNSNSKPQQQQQQQQQQQFFPQTGVNVMMSSSNATHVRLLNASLDSEGSYACEISTQNLSTIRYEREIKVYVLPNSKLNIVGLKSRYSVGDKVDLICSTDYSRPAPALAWFINGQLIDATLAQWFELDQESKSKTNDPSLFRLTLGLKFRLSSELLVSVLNYAKFAGLHNQRNQSLAPISTKRQKKKKQQQQEVGTTSSSASVETLNNKQHHQLSPYQLHSHDDQQQQQQTTTNINKFELKLQCKYKLTEVSDVSFNELVTHIAGGLSSSSSNDKDDIRRRAGRSSKLSPQRKLERGKRWIELEEYDDSSSELEVAKSLDNRLVQSQCPAPAQRALWQALLTKRCSNQPTGLLADDPLILKLDDSSSSSQQVTSANELMSSAPFVRSDTSSGYDEEPHRAKRNQKRDTLDTAIDPQSMATPLESSIGEQISVNCSTVSAFLLEYHNNNWQPSAFSELEQTSQVSPLSVSQPQQCFNEDQALMRRRLIISGKHQQPSGNEDQTVVNQRQHFQQSQQRQRQSNLRQVAYLSLLDQKWLAVNQREQPGKLWSEAASADSSESLSQQQQQQNLLTPPLLEWFINNQEAPKMSAKYSPELPLLATQTLESNKRAALSASTTQTALKSTSVNGGLQLGYKPPGGTTLAPFETSIGAEVAPSVDYHAYFANFNSRPIHQHLVLNLTLDKTHFMTPDSKLRLRCSSTQAQVLLTDSASIVIIASFGNDTQQQQAHSWQQKPTNSKSYNSKSSTQSSSAFKSSAAQSSASVDVAKESSFLAVVFSLTLCMLITMASVRCSYL